MKLKYWTIIAAATVIIGCGGEGGSTGQPVPGNASVSTFATDSINDDYSHVWVKIHKVTLEGSDDAVLVDDSAGKLINLKTLRDAAGSRYSLLDDSSVKAGSYNAIRVELDEDLTLVPDGSSVGQARKFATALAGSAGRSVLRLPGALNMNSGRNTLVVDFDLATWTVDATGRVAAGIRRGNGSGIDDPLRHEDEDFGGTVASLSGVAPNVTFNLSRAGRPMAVRTNAGTRIYNSSGLGSPKLANGLRVEVAGVFVGGSLLASAIKVEDEQNEDPHQIKGMASNLNGAAGTLTVAVTEARGFLPSGASYTLSTTAGTRFLSDAGVILTKAEFFTALAARGANAQVEAEGTARGSAFVAAKVKIEDEDTNEAEVKGRITALDASAGTLSMAVISWEGVSLAVGATIQVTSSGVTVYRLGNATVDKATFFAGISVGSIVEAKGSLSGTTLAATRIKDDD